ncbi:MAG: hypothetical protein ACI909_003602 [Planctomycetota bacterium]
MRINNKLESRIPELAAVIDKVRTELMFKQRQKMNKEIYKKFKERYEIVVEDLPKSPSLANAAESGIGSL